MASKTRDPELEAKADELGVTYQALCYRKKYGIPLDKPRVLKYNYNGRSRPLRVWAKIFKVPESQLYALIYWRMRKHKMSRDKAFASAILALEDTE